VGRYALESILRLYAIYGLGPARIRNLLAAFGSPEAVLQAPVQKLIRVPGIEQQTALSIREKADEKRINAQFEYMQSHKVKILTCWDEPFPQSLKRIYDPPLLLFYRGDIQVLNTKAIGIVGTRNPSTYGKMVTEKFCRELAERDFTIISGLARGVDTIAHQTALKSQGRTVAVLGSGMDMIYPPENRKMADQITEKGVLVSEYLIGTFPDPRNFPRRNRIISGLSLGVLVTEAGEKSGALITAYQALEQNREVFAVPGPINSRKSVGTNLIIKQGATLVQDTQDILVEVENQLIQSEPPLKKKAPTLSGFEKELFEMLTDEPLHIDVLAQKCLRSIPEVLATLLTLELLGIVKQLSGKMFMRITQ
jgi:DNA processing protein